MYRASVCKILLPFTGFIRTYVQAQFYTKLYNVRVIKCNIAVFVYFPFSSALFIQFDLSSSETLNNVQVNGERREKTLKPSENVSVSLYNDENPIIRK